MSVRIRPGLPNSKFMKSILFLFLVLTLQLKSQTLRLIPTGIIKKDSIDFLVNPYEKCNARYRDINGWKYDIFKVDDVAFIIQRKRNKFQKIIFQY